MLDIWNNFCTENLVSTGTAAQGSVESAPLEGFKRSVDVVLGTGNREWLCWHQLGICLAKRIQKGKFSTDWYRIIESFRLEKSFKIESSC